MNDRSDVEALVAAYALDALEPDETRVVEAAVAADPALQTLLDEYRAVAATLAESVETAPSTPSAAVWQNIRVAIGSSEPAPEPPAFAPAVALRRQRWLARLAGGIAAVAMAVAVVLAIQVGRTGNDPMAPAVEALMEDPNARVVTLVAPDGSEVRAEVVVAPDGLGFLVDDTLPALDPQRTYQLWAIVDRGEDAGGTAVISAGVLGPDPDREPFKVAGNLAGLAITEEVAGGVVSSENDPVAVWLRDA